jgi:SAM-dependent methyltransferase
MHDAALEWIRKQYAPVLRKRLQLGIERATVLDIGGRDVNGSLRKLLFDANACTVLDIRPGDGVDIVADAATWDPAGQQWDLIIAAETFEHTANWRAICRTAYAACAPGGRLIVTTAAPGRPPHSAVDGEFRLLPGEHYANIRPAELERVLTAAGWADVVIDVQPAPADVRATAVKEP